MCFSWSVLYDLSLCFLPQSSLLYTPFERAIHDLEFSRILLALDLYLLSLIVLLIALDLYLLSLIVLHIVLHLYLLSLIVLPIVLHLYFLSLIVFALVLHLYLLEHGGVLILKKLLFSRASLILF